MRWLPDVRARHERDGELDLELWIGADCPWFEGHFPGHPILPGVVQIGWAAWFASQWTGHDTPPALLERIKFKRPVRPETSLVLQLRRRSGKIGFEYLLPLPDTTMNVSSGTFGEAGGVP